MTPRGTETVVQQFVADPAWEQVLQLQGLPGLRDPFSAISHLLGAVVFLVLGLLLLYRGRGNIARLLFLGIYVASCVTLFALSGVYHMMEHGGLARRVLVRLDHAAIFIFIAGTFTPAHGLLFRGPWRWGMLLLIWSAAIAGVVLKAVFFDELAEGLSLALYLVLGWLGSAAAVMLARKYGYRVVRPLLWGGVAYSVGAIAEFCRWPVLVAGVIHPHEVFHVAALVGAFLHWRFVWQFATGEVRVPKMTGFAHQVRGGPFPPNG